MDANQAAFDITLIDENIYKLWNQISSKSTPEDVHNEELLKESKLQKHELYQPMTSRNEIIGWLMYDWANSPQWQVMQGLVWTLFVTQNATQYACDNYMEYGCDINNNPINSDQIVKIEMGSISLKPESFFFFVLSMSGIMQLISYVMIGGLMDYQSYQYYIFRVCAVTAALFDAPYIFFAQADSFMFSGWWTAIGIVFFGLSTVAYNSQLVDIVDNHWLVRRADKRTDCPREYVCRIQNRIMADLSSFGYACGYFASLVMTIFSVVILLALAESTSDKLSNYGDTSETNVMEQMYAKNVYGSSIETFYNVNGISQIGSIQLFYDDINLNGTMAGGSMANATKSIFYSTYEINAVLLWYNSDTSIAAMQFETVDSGTKSQLFGDSNGIVDFETVNSDNFVLGGYNVYTKNNNDGNTIISGFDFLFYQNRNQWPSTLGIRVVIFCVFLWWILWQLFTLFTMKKRIKNPIPSDASIWTISAKHTWKTLIEIFKNYKYVRNILIAWFFYSDGLGSALVASVMFAMQLGFNNLELFLMLLEFEICAAVGNIFHLWMQKKLKWDCKQMVMYHLVFYFIMHWYLIIGLIPGIPFGVVNKWELWVFGFIFAFQLGSIQGFGRTLVSNLIPVGKENEIFSIYAITDKGSSWLGPLVMGVISNKAGVRWGMFYIVTCLLISMPFIWKIDIMDGMKQAGKFEEKQQIEASSTVNSNSKEATNVEIATELQNYKK